MATTTAPAPARPPLRRTRERRIAGVAAGIAARFSVDVFWVRTVFVVSTIVAAVGLPVYVLMWLTMDPAEDAPARRLRTGRSAFEVGAGAGLLVLAALLAVRATGVSFFSDTLAWPLVLVAAGGALIWRTSQSTPPASAAEPAGGAAPVPDKPRAAPRAAAGDVAAEPSSARAAWAAAVVSRTGLGVLLIVAAAFVFLQATGTLGAVRDLVVVVLVVAVALGIILAPWIVRLARNLATERSERIRSQERAEVAAHLHDSVLQTLALVQKRADDPRAVAALARSQERELRAWLSGRRNAGDVSRLSDALEAAAGEVERDHGVPVEVVAVGDRPLDEHVGALVAAAREAMVNAAKHAGGEVAVYAEATGDRVEVFVRDRGRGFEPATVPGDRRGIAESIVGRMARHGGSARIHSTPGEGTEVELTL
jgi:signal transduction histidine kinase